MAEAAGTFKGWIPSDYLDESVPAPRPKPDDWLIRGHVMMLEGRDEGGKPEDEPFVVREAQEVWFGGLTDYGLIQIEWFSPGRYDLLTPIPPGATLFWWPGDSVSVTHTLAEFVVAAEDDFDAGEVYAVGCFDWSSKAFALRDGVFVAVDPEMPAVRQ